MIGRTKSAPTEDDDTTSLSFAVFSCGNYPNGYFNAYGDAARKDLARPIAGGLVADGTFQQGEVRMTNLTFNTETGKWGHQAATFNQMYIKYPSK